MIYNPRGAILGDFFCTATLWTKIFLKFFVVRVQKGEIPHSNAPAR